MKTKTARKPNQTRTPADQANTREIANIGSFDPRVVVWIEKNEIFPDRLLVADGDAIYVVDEPRTAAARVRRVSLKQSVNWFARWSFLQRQHTWDAHSMTRWLRRVAAGLP